MYRDERRVTEVSDTSSPTDVMLSAAKHLGFGVRELVPAFLPDSRNRSSRLECAKAEAELPHSIDSSLRSA